MEYGSLSIRAYRKYHIRFGILSSRTIPLLCRHRIRQKYRMQNTRPRTFYVAHRTITAVYTNTEPKKTDHSIDGPFVILELSLQDADAPMLFDENEEGRVPRNSPPPIAAGMPSAAPDSYAVCAENRLEITQCGK